MNKFSYFEFQAEVGLTKHIGGMRVTNELVELCKIKKDSKILEIGCGVGLTSAYLAKKFGCTVTGIDISEGMIGNAKKTAEREGVADKTKFMVGDAQKLPFRDNAFDVVIAESVMAFIPERNKAMNEFVRVIRPGGYVGITEVAWTKEPPPEMKKKMADFAGSKMLAPGGWKKLFIDAGLDVVAAKTYKLRIKEEAWEEIRRWSLVEYLKVQYRVWKGIFTKPSYRRFIMDALKLPWKMIDYWGYGVYVGKKS